MMLTPSFWSKDTPDTSSKQTTSYWQTKPALAGCHVDEHPGDRRLAARDQDASRARSVGTDGSCRCRAGQVRRRCNCARRTGPCAAARHSARACRQLVGLKTDAAQQEILPLLGRQLGPALADPVEDAARRKLDRADRVDLERPAPFLLGDRGVVAEIDLGIEAPGQHPLVLAHQRVADPHVVQPQARQGREIAVAPCFQPRGDDVDDADRSRRRAPGI